MSYMQYVYSLCGTSELTTDVRVGDGVMEDAHPSKCILAVLLSLMNVVVLTTTVKLYLVSHRRLVKAAEFIFGSSSFINTRALI